MGWYTPTKMKRAVKAAYRALEGGMVGVVGVIPLAGKFGVRFSRDDGKYTPTTPTNTVTTLAKTAF